MRYVLVSPSSREQGNGLSSYSRNVVSALERAGLEPTWIARPPDLSWVAFRQLVRDTITTRFRPEEIVVEAPEEGSATLLVPPEYRVHIRLHCPGAFVQMHNARPADWEGFRSSLEVARRARVVSSPSYALLRELDSCLDVSAIHVYKNPPPSPVVADGPMGKTHDVIFFGRFRRVKGIDLLNDVLSRLPRSYSVVLAGEGSEAFEVSPTVRCEVRLYGEVLGAERFRLLGGARAALMLSRFENCSMVVLECLAVGTVVVGWQVGGHAEIAGPELIRLVPFGDMEALAATVVAAVEGGYPHVDTFRAATARVEEDFSRGWARAYAALHDGARAEVYRGLDCGRG